VGEHWEELSTRLAHWLGLAFREDDSLPGQVALIMMRRYQNGHGLLVTHLRANRYCNEDEATTHLFVEAHWVCREVLPGAVEQRRRRSRHVELDANLALGNGNDVEALTGPRPRGFGPTDPATLDGALRVALSAAERAWVALCDANLLNNADWTDEQRWVAMAMSCDLTVAQITALRNGGARRRALRDGPCPPVAPVITEASTRQMMSVVRRKGKVLLEAMPRTDRQAHDLLGRGRR
jgi:hypothetical protein